MSSTSEPTSNHVPTPVADGDTSESDTTEITDTRPTTAEEAMDAESDGEGFVDESAYSPRTT